MYFTVDARASSLVPVRPLSQTGVARRRASAWREERSMKNGRALRTSAVVRDLFHRLLNRSILIDCGVLAGTLAIYAVIFARVLFSGEYTFGGDTYLYWSLRYMVLYSVKHFGTLPWWDPMVHNGYPLYFHLTSGWSNYLSPYYLPSILLFKFLNIFTDVSINTYLVFHQTIYINFLCMLAILLISREIIINRTA